MRIILASASPRRIELLKSFHLDFDVIPSNIRETTRKEEQPQQIVMSLAFLKAIKIANEHPDALVIASDTIVYKNSVLGKPSDINEAEHMLKELSGSSHQVYTGLALMHLKSGRQIVDYDVTTVRFHELNSSVIDKYLETNEPMDKAGAYGIQGYGALLVKGIVGDFYNVMGLPLSKLNELLNNYFGVHML